MNTKLDIRTGLIVGIIDSNIAYPVQWPNVPIQDNGQSYEPNNEPWVRVTILGMEDGMGTLGKNGKDRVDGAMQIDIFTPKASGDIKAYEILQELRSQFERGKILTHNGQHVRIESAGSRQGTDEQSWYSQIINVEFSSYLSRGN